MNYMYIYLKAVLKRMNWTQFMARKKSNGPSGSLDFSSFFRAPSVVGASQHESVRIRKVQDVYGLEPKGRGLTRPIFGNLCASFVAVHGEDVWDKMQSPSHSQQVSARHLQAKAGNSIGGDGQKLGIIFYLPVSTHGCEI